LPEPDFRVPLILFKPSSKEAAMEFALSRTKVKD
jgi:hypothetical protein